MHELMLASDSDFGQALTRIHASDEILSSNRVEPAKRNGGFQSVQSDIQAIELWLHNQYRDRDKTRRAYSKELLRFILWADIALHKMLSTLSERDIQAYFQFILDPQPRDYWCLSDKNARPKKDSPDWRPFAGPIQSVASYNQVHAAISCCFSYLKAANYLKYDPMRLINLPKFNTSKTQRKLDVSHRVLNQVEWNAFIDVLLELPETDRNAIEHKHRLRFIIATLFFLGLRVEELVNLKWSDFAKLEDYWLVRVTGKGRASESEADGVLCSVPYLQEVTHYRTFLDLPTEPAGESGTAIFSWTTGEPLSTSSIRKIIKKHGALTAEQFTNDSLSYQKLQALSPHWLRHLCASRLSQSDVNVRHIKEHLRHKNSETTYLYIHSDLSERLDEINKIGWI